jgi:hypothetical protein
VVLLDLNLRRQHTANISFILTCLPVTFFQSRLAPLSNLHEFGTLAKHSVLLPVCQLNQNRKQKTAATTLSNHRDMQSDINYFCLDVFF